MKKLLPKLALALAPFAVYFCVFAAFDPYNYFGFQKTTNDNNPISRVQAYQKNPQSSIILGDSRMAHFDLSLAQQASGHSWSNLAFGGASLEESLDLLYYAYDQNPALERVVLGLSFYTLNSAYGSVSRMSTIEQQLKNPAAYLFNLEYNVNMLTNLANRLTGAAGADAEEHREPLPDDYTAPSGEALSFRRDLIVYAGNLYSNCAKAGVLLTVQSENGVVTNLPALESAMQNMTPAASKFALNEKQLARLIEAAAFCAQRGIELTVVLPPMDESVRALVCAPLGIDTEMQSALAQLSAAGVRLLDYEWTDTAAWETDELFFDGFHLDTRSGLPLFTRTLFSEVA